MVFLYSLPKPLRRRGCPEPYLHTFSRFKLYPICFFAFCLNPMLLSPMFICYSVFKTYVIEKYVFLSFRLKSMLLCLQSPCSSVSHKSLTLLGWGEAVPRERENQINTLVLKDINFTINIIDCLITERLIP